jgi:hypothetical protein
MLPKMMFMKKISLKGRNDKEGDWYNTSMYGANYIVGSIALDAGAKVTGYNQFMVASNVTQFNIPGLAPSTGTRQVPFVVVSYPYDPSQQEWPDSVLLVPVWTLSLNENSTHHFYGFLRCFHTPRSPSANPLKTM